MIKVLEEMLADTSAVADARITCGRLQAEIAERKSLHDEAISLRQHTEQIRDASERLTRVMTQFSLLEKAGRCDVGTLAIIRDMHTDLGVTVRGIPTPTVIEFLEDTFIGERCLEADTQRHLENYVRLFAIVTGNKHMNAYVRRDFTDWIRFLEKLKSSYGRGKPLIGKSKDQILRDSGPGKGKKTLSRTTIEKHITHVKGFFKRALKHYRFARVDEIDDLFDGNKLSKGVPEPCKRLPWTMAQLSALFLSPIWSGTRSRREDRTRRHEVGPQIHRDAYWWLPPAALWTGTRLEEIAQVHHEDLQFDRDRIPYLKIHKEGERQLKNDNSIRNVPIHPFLVELGFLDLFKPKAKGRVFSELKRHGRPPKCGGLYTGHFTDYRKAVELYEELRDFHSLRHTFITQMRHGAGVDIFTIAALVGHRADDPDFVTLQQTNDYTAYSIANLRDAIVRLDYESLGLDVSMLRRGAAACGPNGSAWFAQAETSDRPVDKAA
jgi:integrase